MDRLFTLLSQDDPETVEILTRWTKTRDRQLFYQRV